MFDIFISKIFYNSSKFLSYMFKHITANNVSHIYNAYPVSKLIDEFFFFFAISNNRLFSLSNEFFFNDDKYQ